MSRRQRAESQCRDCQADILWATQSTGGRVPLNLEPEEITATSRGPFYLLDELEMICSKADSSVIEQAIENGDKLFTNHLVSCTARRNAA